MSSVDSPYSLLVVDDQVTNLQLLCHFLSEYQVHTADNGFLALEKANELLPDLILLDINMPELDGYQVCERLKNNPTTCDIPIIFITGLSEPSQINKGLQVGAIDYITKPFSLSEVRARVKNHLALKSVRESLKKKNLLLEKKIQEQTISSELARRVLQFINRTPARYTDLANDLSLFVHVISRPCHDEGGDHSFVQTFPVTEAHSARTILSVKDQSGHSVNCILRSIVTDLAHNSILRKFPGIEVGESMTRLNNAILAGGIFETDNFFTGVTAELNHETLSLKYLSAGHPSIILIRGSEIALLPERGGNGANLPVAFMDDVIYTSTSTTLQTGDKLLFFTDGLTDMSLDSIGSVFAIDDIVTILKNILRIGDISISFMVDKFLEELQSRSTSPGDAKLRHFPDDITIMGVEIEPTPKDKVLWFKPGDFESIDACISSIVTHLVASSAKKNSLISENRLTIPVSEAVLNAWKHGNTKDPAKEIGIHWWYGNDFNVEIISQGTGFDYHHYSNPATAANLTKENGRGIFLIKKSCDYVRWRDGGRNIILSFSLCESSWNNSDNQTNYRPFDIW